MTGIKEPGKRKPLSKKIRFEVFKRDKFVCQYCGRMAPDVILEVDHIVPVAEGGDNGLLNLITACRDCNRGKGKTRISDNDAIKKQQTQLKELAEKREQSEMLMEWKRELSALLNEQADLIADYICSITGWGLSKCGLSNMKKYINRFGFSEVQEAVDIAFSHYYDGTDDSWELAFDKIGGICYNRRKKANGDL